MSDSFGKESIRSLQPKRALSIGGDAAGLAAAARAVGGELVSIGADGRTDLWTAGRDSERPGRSAIARSELPWLAPPALLPYARKSFDLVSVEGLLETLDPVALHSTLLDLERLSSGSLILAVAVGPRTPGWWLNRLNRFLSVPTSVRFIRPGGGESLYRLNEDPRLQQLPIFGLMLTKNEEDGIEEVMREHSRYVDRILVLDDSDDRTPEIVRSFETVVYFAKQKEIYPEPIKGPVDWIRQHLLEVAQKRYGTEGWFLLLHGDEIWYDNPRKAIMEAEAGGAEIANFFSAGFFLHSSEKEGFEAREDPSLPIQTRRLWHMLPLHKEKRAFKNKPDLAYPIGVPSRLYPDGIDRRRAQRRVPIYKHYAYRTPEQALGLARDRTETGFQRYHRWILERDDVFVDVLPGLAGSRRFEGRFRGYDSFPSARFIRPSPWREPSYTADRIRAAWERLSRSDARPRRGAAVSRKERGR